MVGKMRVLGNDFTYVNEGNLLYLYNDDHRAIHDLAENFIDQNLIGTVYGSGYELFIGCFLVGYSLCKDNHARFRYSIRIECSNTEPSINSLSISGPPIEWFFNSHVLEKSDDPANNGKLSVHEPPVDCHTFSWKTHNFEISHYVSITNTIYPDRPFSSKSILQLHFPNPINLVESLLLIDDIRDFFTFLYNTKSIDLTIHGSASEYKEALVFHYASYKSDAIFNEYIFDKFSMLFDNWAQAIASYISLKNDTSHIQLSSEYRRNPMTLFPKLLVFDNSSKDPINQSNHPIFASLKTEAKKHIRKLEASAPQADSCYYDALCYEIGKLNYIPKFQERLSASLADNSYWLDNQLLKINSHSEITEPLTPATIAKTCYELRISYAHNGKSITSSLSELLSLCILEEVIYCLVLDRVKAIKDNRDIYLQKVFRL